MGKFKMVKVQLPAHVVVDQWRIRMRAHRGDLCAVLRHNLIRGKAAKRQFMAGVGLSHREVWQVDLADGVIFHRPEHIAPCGVQRLRALVTLGKPVAKPVPGSV